MIGFLIELSVFALFVYLWWSFRIKKTPKKNVPLNGMKAKEEGFAMSDNPYRNHSADYSIWRDDWLFASGRFR